MSEILPESNNSERIVDAEIAANEKSRRADFIRKQLGQIREVQEGAVTDRQKFAASQAFTKLATALEGNEAKWEQTINDKLNERATLSQLRAETDKIQREIEDDVKTIAGYIHSMGLINENDLPAILHSTSQNAQKIVEILHEKKKYPEVVEALKFALGQTDKKEEAFAAFEHHLEGDKAEVKSFVWTAMSFMKSADKIEFAETYAKNRVLYAEDVLRFLEEGNKFGVYSPMEMKAVLENLKDYDKVKEDFDAKKEQYAAIYTITHDFKEEALRLAGESYGSKNAASEMLTGKNAIIFIAQLAAGLTIAGNIAANVFEGGKFHPTHIKGAFNKPTKVAAAILFASTHQNEIKEFIKPKAQRETDNKTVARNFLNKKLNSNPYLEDFLSTNGTYAATKVFKEYTDYVQHTYGDDSPEFPKNMATNNGFEIWLNLKAKTSKGASIYPAILAQFKSTNMSDKEVGDLAKSVRTLNIKDENSYRKQISIINRTT